MDQSQVITRIAECKRDPLANVIWLESDLGQFRLLPLGRWAIQQHELIRLMTEWRSQNQSAFPSCFKVTVEGTRRWFETRVDGDPERLLFGLFDDGNQMVGHAGLGTFCWQAGDCEIDNIMRGHNDAPKGLMTEAVQRLVEFAYDQIGATTVSLRVFGDNVQAIKLYIRCGFKHVESIPMECVFDDGGFTWQPQEEFQSGQTTRIFLKMTTDRNIGTSRKAAA